MLTKVIGVAFAVILAPVYLFGLAGLLIWSPVLLWRRLRPSKPRRGPPGRLARTSRWFSSEDAAALMTFVSLVVILAGSLVACFVVGVDPIGVAIVGGMMTLGALGIFKSHGGGPG